MRKLIGLLLGLSFIVATAGSIEAQEKMDAMQPPKVLVINREFLKPGKGGSAHDKSESAFVQAFAKAKWPTRYLAMDSLSGRSRALYLAGYDSFEAWEKDNQAIQSNTTVGAALERAAMADGDLLSDYDTTVLTYSEEYSLRPGVDVAQMRYFEISLFQIRPGHRKDWDDLVKLVMAAYEKIPDVRWATYEVAYGQMGNTYAVFSPMKSAAEIDKAFAQGKEFMANMGPEGMKKFADLSSAAIESSQSNLFQFNPRSSYPPDRFLKDPFWKPAGTP